MKQLPEMSQEPSASNSADESLTKRKRQKSDDEPSRKRTAKRKEKSQSTASGEEVTEDDLSVNPTIAGMDGQLIADFFARQIKRFEPDLSLIELQDRRIPEKAFVDTTSWSQRRDLQTLPSFLEHFTTSSKHPLYEASEAKGSPHTLIVTSAGVRAADIRRSLRVYQTKTATVAKLFAKHIKLGKAVIQVQNTRMSIGVGTPQRLLDLVNHGALSLKHLARIVIDGSHVDQKKRGIMDIRETAMPLLHLLALEGIKDGYEEGGQGNGNIQILVF